MLLIVTKNVAKNMKNNITKKIVSLLAVVAFALPLSVLAATSLNTDSKDYATLRVTNSTTNGSPTESWVRSTTATGGDTVSFAVYYHNTGNETARNVRIKLSSPSGTSQSSYTLTATVDADNASAVSGSATVSITGNPESLQFLGVRWYPNQTQGAQTPIPSGQSGSAIFSSSGLSIGDIAPGWGAQGSVVIGFRVNDTGTNDVTPTVDISASPTSISSGDQSRLTWNSTNADSCYSTNGWSGNKAVDGSQYVYPSQTTTYTIICQNGSRTAQDSVTVYVNDDNNNNLSVDMYASPTSISRSDSSTLYWSSTDADYCTASGGWSGSRSTNGSLRVYPSQTTTYYITCYRDGEQRSDGATVYVNDSTGNLSVDLRANPTSINRGSASLLSWTSYGADYCTAFGGWSGSKNTSGSEYVYPISNTTYSLNCYKNGSVSGDNETVYVNDNNYNGNLAVSCSADPASVKTGDNVTFAVAAAGGRAPYTFSWTGAVDGSASVQYRTYSTTGVKTAYVTARDADGRSVNTSCSVTVNARSTYTPPVTKPTPKPVKSCQTITICSDAGNAIDLANQLRFCSANLNNTTNNNTNNTEISGPVEPTPDQNTTGGQLSSLSLFGGTFWGGIMAFFLFALILAIIISAVLYFLLRREGR
jgi:uncharacterized repeat protein (TIGR01451 family)